MSLRLIPPTRQPPTPPTATYYHQPPRGGWWVWCDWGSWWVANDGGVVLRMTMQWLAVVAMVGVLVGGVGGLRRRLVVMGGLMVVAVMGELMVVAVISGAGRWIGGSGGDR
ncbi:hypothetical protein Tco_0897050 [Tanacetum coccineum]